MTKMIITILATLTMTVASIPAASACSCKAQSPANYVKQADRVFLGRPGKPIVKGKQSTRVFHVFFTLKGKHASNVVVPNESPHKNMCAPEFKTGETVLVFVKNGRTHICDGNSDLSNVLPDFAKYVAAAGIKTTNPSLSVFKAAMEATLKPYLHKRKFMPIIYKSLLGKSFRIGETHLKFMANSPRPGITIYESLSAGPISFISGRFHSQGVNFSVLIGATKSGYEVLGKRVVETKRK